MPNPADGSSDTDILIVGLKCLDQLLRKPAPRHLGGIERQLVTLARALANTGQRVAFATFGDAVEDHKVDGINVYSVFQESAGLPGTRFLHPRATSIIGLARRLRPKTVLQMGSGIETAAAAIAARLCGARFVFLAGSNMDCSREQQAGYSKLDQIGYRYGLGRADVVIAQTKTQQQMFRDEFSTESDVLPLPYIRPVEIDPNAKPDNIDIVDVLWVGRLVKEKRPERLAQVAQALPDVRFGIVGASNQDDDYARASAATLDTCSNIERFGKISDDDLLALYAHCDLLCCTSDIEGFPTTFLEAWSFGKPVVTTFDPDGVVAREGLGIACSDVDQVIAGIARLRQDQDHMSDHILSYFDRHYTEQACTQGLLALINRGA